MTGTDQISEESGVGLDRFGRVVDQRWTNGTLDDLDRYSYTYDRSSNVTSKFDLGAWHAPLSLRAFNEEYVYDGLGRLVSATRGNGESMACAGTQARSRRAPLPNMPSGRSHLNIQDESVLAPLGMAHEEPAMPCLPGGDGCRARPRGVMYSMLYSSSGGYMAQKRLLSILSPFLPGKMRIAILLCMCLACCNREGQVGTGTGSTLVVTGERGGDLGHQKCVRAGTATSNHDASDTYVYTLLIKYPIDLATTAPPASKERSTVDQGAGVIESTGGASLGAVMNTRFSLKDQILVINQVKVDLKNGSIVIIELGADGKVIVHGQCAASAPFNDDAVKYVKELESKCTEVAAFLKE